MTSLQTRSLVLEYHQVSSHLIWPIMHVHCVFVFKEGDQNVVVVVRAVGDQTVECVQTVEIGRSLVD